jgi:hypothetical protein
VLSPLQERLVALVAESLAGSDFALAGGAALISQGLVERRTNDLDFFGSSEAALAESKSMSNRDWASFGH